MWVTIKVIISSGILHSTEGVEETLLSLGAKVAESGSLQTQIWQDLSIPEFRTHHTQNLEVSGPFGSTPPWPASSDKGKCHQTKLLSLFFLPPFQPSPSTKELEECGPEEAERKHPAKLFSILQQGGEFSCIFALVQGPYLQSVHTKITSAPANFSAPHGYDKQYKRY